MKGAEKATSMGELHRAGMSFFCAAVLCGMAAVFWFGDTGLFHYLAVLPGLVGLLLVYSGFHALFASSTPATTLQIDVEPLRLGTSATVVIRQKGPVKLSSLRANLICERIDRPTGSKSRKMTYPCQQNFLDAGAVEVGHMETREFHSTLTVPKDGEPSVEGVSLKIRWRIEVWGKVIGAADFMRPFEVEVVE